MGDDSHQPIQGKGNVIISLNDGQERILLDFLHVPALRKNLFPNNQLVLHGESLLVEPDQCILRDKMGNVIAQCISKNKLYRLGTTSSNPLSVPANVSYSVSYIEEQSTYQWHLKLGHMSLPQILQMKQHHMVKVMEKCFVSTLTFCTSCVIGKSTRAKLPSEGATRAIDLLGLVHTDFCGPLRIPTFSGRKYFITFIDDMSSTRMYICCRRNLKQNFKSSNRWLKIIWTSASRFCIQIML